MFTSPHHTTSSSDPEIEDTTTSTTLLVVPTPAVSQVALEETGLFEKGETFPHTTNDIGRTHTYLPEMPNT